MTNYLLNAFSLQMIADNAWDMHCETIDSLPEGLESAIGHPDLAAILGVPYNRVSVQLHKGDTAYVAQLFGGRLPEGSTHLPENFTLKFKKITIF